MENKIIEQKAILLTALVLVIVIVLAIFIPTYVFSAVDKQEIKTGILGGMDVETFIVMSFYAFLGVLVKLLADYTKRVPSNPTSPEKFSRHYWLRDNWRKALSSVILTFIALICCPQIFGTQINILNAFFIGFGSDYLMEIMKSKNIIIAKGYDITKEAK